MTNTQINIETDFDATPGWVPMGVGLPADFLEGDPVQILTTVAMLCMQPTINDATPHPQAIATLALFATGCNVTLSTKQFRRLERTVVQYLGALKSDKRFVGTRNHEFVSYVRDRAVERAQNEMII